MCVSAPRSQRRDPRRRRVHRPTVRQRRALQRTVHRRHALRLTVRRPDIALRRMIATNEPITVATRTAIFVVAASFPSITGDHTMLLTTGVDTDSVIRRVVTIGCRRAEITCSSQSPAASLLKF